MNKKTGLSIYILGGIIFFVVLMIRGYPSCKNAADLLIVCFGCLLMSIGWPLGVIIVLLFLLLEYLKTIPL